MTNEINFDTLAGRLEHIIREAGYEKNKKGFSKKCCLSGNQIYNYTDGSQEPGTKFYRGLKDFLPDISIDWLITGDGKPYIDDLSGQSGNVLDLQHERVIREFDDKEFALELNQALVVLEKRSLKEFYEIGGYIKGLVKQGIDAPPDRRQRQRRQGNNTHFENDRRTGHERRKAVGED